MPLKDVLLPSFIALITMVNPLAVIPSFVALTYGASRRARFQVAVIAGLSCMVVLIVFLLAGNWVFQFFGITVPAFQIMGGIIFLIIFIAGVGLISILVLLAAMPISRVIGDRGRAVSSKILALLLGAIGIQFIINGVKPVLLDIMKMG